MNQSHHRLTKLAALASVIGLVACGGGGGESSPPNTASSMPNQSLNQYGSTNPQPNETTQPMAGAAPNATTSTESSPVGYGHDAGATSSESMNGQGYSNAPSTMGTSGTSSSGTSTTPYASPGSQSSGSGTNAPSDTMGSSTSTTGDSSGMVLTEAQLDGALAAINQGEIQAGQLAQSKSSSPAVKRFAQHMTTEHRDLESKANAAFSRAQVTATDSSESRQLKSSAQNDLANLQSQSGHDFDVAYVDTQVKGHNQALELIDRALPSVKHSEVKTALQSARTRVEEHLREAEHLQQELQMGNTDTQGGSNSNNPSQRSPSQNNPSGSMEH